MNGTPLLRDQVRKPEWDGMVRRISACFHLVYVFFSLAAPHGLQNIADQGSNLSSLLWKHSLRHWTTREVPICLVLKQASREEGKVGSLRERMYSQLGQGLLASHLYPTDLFPRASHVPGIGEAEKRDLGPTPAPLGAQSSGEAQDNIQLPFFVVS